MKHKHIAVTLLVSTILITGDSFAGFVTIGLSSGKGYRQFPSSAESVSYGISDGTIVAWLEESRGGSLLAQKVLSDGSLAWQTGGAVADTDLGTLFDAEHDYPMVFTDGRGGALMIYRKHDEVYAVGISAKGELYRDPAMLSSAYDGINYNPRAAQSSDFRIVVVWENFCEGIFNIHAQKIDSYCEKQWQSGDEVQVIRHWADQRKPEIALTNDRSSLITWLDTRNISWADSGSYDTYGILVGADGNIISDLEGTSLHRAYHPPQFKSLIEKIQDYSHKPAISGNNFFIAIEEGFAEGFSKIMLKKYTLKFEPLLSYDLQPAIKVSQTQCIGDGSGGIVIFWKASVGEGNELYTKRFCKEGKPYDGSTEGFEFGCVNQKIITEKSFGRGSSPAIFNTSTGTFCLPWVGGTGGQLFFSESSLSDKSEACKYQSLLSNGQVLEGNTSVTTQVGKPVVVYNLAHEIFIAVRDLKRKSDISQLSAETIANSPNPFNPTTTIHFTLPSYGFVRLSIYDISGKLVERSLEQYMESGKHSFEFDGSNLATGTYFYRLEAENVVKTGKMLMLK